VALADRFKARLSDSDISRLRDAGAVTTLWKSSSDGPSQLLRDVRIGEVHDDLLSVEFPDGHTEMVSRRNLFVPATVLRRINLDGSFARVFDVLAFFGW
jgi:hypothetical protein